MKRNRFSEEQIISILKQAEAGIKVADICRQNGISDATFYKWRAKYGGLEISDAKRLRQLEAQNTQLKKLVAEQALDIAMLKDVISKNAWSPSLPGKQPTFFKKNMAVPKDGHVKC